MNKIIQFVLFMFACAFVFVMGAFWAWSSNVQDLYCTVEVVGSLCSKYTVHMIIESILAVAVASIAWFIARAGAKQ